MTENASFEKLTESSNIGQVRTRIRRIETRLKDKLHRRGWQSGRSILSSECI
jgi:ppGpp synthetase/RelA/SpoT-type nucleotidyltranferase